MKILNFTLHFIAGGFMLVVLVGVCLIVWAVEGIHERLWRWLLWEHR